MSNEEFEEGELVLCTVDKIIGTTVFVKLENTNLEGTITTSEIAPGRIRNLRDYVIPNKKIVCKVLKAEGEKIQLSLRRVKPNERKELLDKIEKEKSFKAILRTILGKENTDKIIEKLTEKQNLTELFEDLKENINFLENIIGKENTNKIIKILDSKKEKPKEIKQVIKLSSKSSNGIVIVKDILKESCNNSLCKINYIAAGKYNLSIEGKDFKKIKNEITNVLDKIEKLSKTKHCEFSVEKS